MRKLQVNFTLTLSCWRTDEDALYFECQDEKGACAGADYDGWPKQRGAKCTHCRGNAVCVSGWARLKALEQARERLTREISELRGDDPDRANPDTPVVVPLELAQELIRLAALAERDASNRETEERLRKARLLLTAARRDAQAALEAEEDASGEEAGEEVDDGKRD